MKKIHCIISLWLFVILLSASSCLDSPSTEPDVFFSFFAREYAAMAGGRPLDIAYTYADSSGFIETYTARDGCIQSLKHTSADTRNIFSSLVKLAATIPETFTRRGDLPDAVSEFHPAHLEFFIISNTAVIFAWSGKTVTENPEIRQCIEQCKAFAVQDKTTAPIPGAIALRADLLDKKTAAEFLSADLFINQVDISRNPVLSNAVCSPFKLIPVPTALTNPLYPYVKEITVGRDTLECDYGSHYFQIQTWQYASERNL